MLVYISPVQNCTLLCYFYYFSMFCFAASINLCLGNMVCTSKITKIWEYPSRDPACPLESRHSLEYPMWKPSWYGINRYMGRFLLCMPLTHSGPVPLPSIWNGSLYLKPFRFFTQAGCHFRITHVWNASFIMPRKMKNCTHPRKKSSTGQIAIGFRVRTLPTELVCQTVFLTAHRIGRHPDHCLMRALQRASAPRISIPVGAWPCRCYWGAFFFVIIIIIVIYFISTSVAGEIIVQYWVKLLTRLHWWG